MIRWMYSIKIGRVEKEWSGISWMELAQDKNRWSILVNTVMNRRVP